ncbi:MAG: hypothetical protein HYS27_22610 [Deltaproteobacteria bacterium]|nr:hypothetical protein [Deltaproteobacteria bacterium]
MAALANSLLRAQYAASFLKVGSSSSASCSVFAHASSGRVLACDLGGE